MKKLLNLTSDQLWNEARRGNRAAFEMLYRKTVIQLINQAFKILKDDAKAEDIVQEVFISVYIKRNEIPADININGYLSNAVKYKVSNALRDEMRKEKHLHALAKSARQQNAVEAAPAYDKKELQQHIGNSIEKLPEKCRHAFKLNY